MGNVSFSLVISAVRLFHCSPCVAFVTCMSFSFAMYFTTVDDSVFSSVFASETFCSLMALSFSYCRVLGSGCVQLLKRCVLDSVADLHCSILNCAPLPCCCFILNGPPTASRRNGPMVLRVSLPGPTGDTPSKMMNHQSANPCERVLQR